MSGPPRISVVLIVRNGERFISEAIRSVHRQSLTDWELVAVDDGSTDRTAELLEADAANLGGRMRIVRHPGGVNRGMSASRNLGIRESRGPLVSFLDHDDLLEPGKLAEHVAALERHPEADVVIGPNLRWSSWADPSLPDQPQDLGVPADVTLDPPGPLPAFLARSSAAPLGITVRRAALDAVGGFEESFTGMYEDQVLLAKLFLRHRVHVIAPVLHRYRQHPDSCVRRTFGRGSQSLTRRRYLLWLRNHLREHGHDDPRLTALLRTEIARTRFARWPWLKRQAIRGLARIARVAGFRRNAG
jgi:glycosyltransferase involved in cell wall biosynthesis